MEERLQRAREALRLEKEVHAATKKKLEYMMTSLMARGEAAEVEKGLLLSPTRKGSGEALTQVAHQMSMVTRATLDALRGRVLQESMWGAMFTMDKKAWRDHAATRRGKYVHHCK